MDKSERESLVVRVEMRLRDRCKEYGETFGDIKRVEMGADDEMFVRLGVMRIGFKVLAGKIVDKWGLESLEMAGKGEVFVRGNEAEVELVFCYYGERWWGRWWRRLVGKPEVELGFSNSF